MILGATIWSITSSLDFLKDNSGINCLLEKKRIILGYHVDNIWPNTIEENKVLWAFCRYRNGASNSTGIEVREDKDMLESTNGDKIYFLLDIINRRAWEYNERVWFLDQANTDICLLTENLERAQELCRFIKEFLGLDIYKQLYSISNNEIRRKIVVSKEGLQKVLADLFKKEHLDL
ncbi:13435_t:CDS:2 [Gigaspora margarita]|uniref:13435_t:CDS:1 n=1 Tax=Gigaspora margarita TaxID=4874 RepID=A0ABN7UQ17_GIGMA|nr:13435_t:CDS:2 [Gigaspora margarita]